MSDTRRPDGWEVRQSGQIRLDASGDRRLKGYAIVFNRQSLDLGGFKEIILPEAIRRTLRESMDVRALIDHDPSKILGRVTAGTLRLTADGHGLKVDIDPPNTTAARDLLESVERGDVSGMSFAFRTLEDDWHLEDGLPIREVLDMEVREVSVVSFPAYPQTSVEMAQRSLQAFQATQKGRSVAWLNKLHRTRLAS